MTGPDHLLLCKPTFPGVFEPMRTKILVCGYNKIKFLEPFTHERTKHGEQEQLDHHEHF